MKELMQKLRESSIKEILDCDNAADTALFVVPFTVHEMLFPDMLIA